MERPVKPQFRSMHIRQLDDWYKDQVGYSPLADNPSTTLEDLHEMCESYWIARYWEPYLEAQAEGK